MRFLKKNNKFQFLNRYRKLKLIPPPLTLTGWGGRGNLGFPTLAQAMSF